jgi:twinkle protein
MSTDKLKQALPNGIETEYGYLVNCPICGERYAFQIYAAGVWRCVACNEYGDFARLKELKGDEFLTVLADKNRPQAPEGLILLGSYTPPATDRSFSTGFNPLDREIGGLEKGNLTILTGRTGHGKSTFMGQMALGLLNDGARVCFYSGELKARDFQAWILNQAAGPNYLDSYVDRFGKTRYRVEDWIKERIKAWLLEKEFLLYDNSIVKSSERNSIIERFATARNIYGCNMFFVDNLMSAKIQIDQERDFYRAQSNFVQTLKEFALTNDAHIVLAAHPRKDASGSWNDQVSGSGNITNLADCVLAVTRLTGKDHDADIDISKGRMWGDTGAIAFNFDKNSRRFVLTAGKQITRYGWEDYV